MLRSSDVDGDTATVRLDFVHGADGPFQSEWTQEETFRLARAGSAAARALSADEGVSLAEIHCAR